MTSSISGLGAGLDLSSVVAQLMQVERAPEQAIKTARLASLSRQTAWSTLGDKLSALQTSASALSTLTKAQSSSATSSNTSVVTAVAGPGAQLGAVNLVVDRLATAQQLRTGGLTSAAMAVGAGEVVLSAGLATIGASSVTTSGATATGTHTIDVQVASQPARVHADTAPALNYASGNDLSVTLADGSTVTVTLAAGYASSAQLLADLNAQLGSVATAQMVAGQLEIATRLEGSQASLQLSGSAVASLGFSSVQATGNDAQVSVDGQTPTSVALLDGSTPLDLGDGITLAAGTHLSQGKAVLNVVRTDASTTLADLVSSINTGGSPVSASLVDTKDGTAAPYRLVLSANATGSAGAVTLTGSGINVLEPTELSTVQPATDAQLQVGGAVITRSSNTIDDVIPGVTLSLVHTSGAGDPPATVTVGRDAAAMTAKVQGLVDAVNAVLSGIKKDTAYDATTKKGGPLNGDGTARSIANGLLNQVLGAVGTGSSVKVLSQLGIQTTRDGSLTFDTTAFTSAVQRDPDGVASTLSTFAKAVADEAKAQTGLDGVVTTAGKAAGDDAAARQKAIDAFEVRMTALEKTYNARFAALDALLGRLKAQQSTLATALSSLPKSGE